MKKIEGLNMKKECDELMARHPDLIDRYLTALSELNETEVVEVSMIIFKETSPELIATLTVFMNRVSDKIGELLLNNEDEDLEERLDKIEDLMEKLEEEDENE